MQQVIFGFFLAASIIFSSSGDAYRPEDTVTLAAYAIFNTTETINERSFFEYPNDLYDVLKVNGRLGQQIGMGRCPDEHKGCYDQRSNRVLGCCQEDQTCAMVYGPFPNQPSQFIGCVDDPLQLCYDKMCPPGYGCCRDNSAVRNDRQVRPYAFCLPIDMSYGWTFDPAVFGPFPEEVEWAMGNFTDYCGEAIEILANGVPVQVALESFPPWTLFNTSQGQYIDYQCVGGGNGAYCAVGDACGTQDIVTVTNFATGELIVEAQETYCCPADQTLCLVGRPPFAQWPGGTPENVTQQFTSTTFLGCAIDDRNETCCGQSICGGGSKCCVAFIDNTFTDPNTNTSYIYNDTLTSFCCPNQAHCCYGYPFNPNSTYLEYGAYGSEGLVPSDYIPDSAYGYCGYTYQDNPCGIDIMVPEGWLFDQAFLFP